jgi:hypothetical protein
LIVDSSLPSLETAFTVFLDSRYKVLARLIGLGDMIDVVLYRTFDADEVMSTVDR